MAVDWHSGGRKSIIPKARTATNRLVRRGAALRGSTKRCNAIRVAADGWLNASAQNRLQHLFAHQKTPGEGSSRRLPPLIPHSLAEAPGQRDRPPHSMNNRLGIGPAMSFLIDRDGAFNHAHLAEVTGSFAKGTDPCLSVFGEIAADPRIRRISP